MREPIIYTAKCPYCGHVGGIKQSDAGNFWLSDSVWRCGGCDEFVDRNYMKEDRCKNTIEKGKD